MSNSLTTYVCEGSEVVELFVFFLFLFFNSNCNEGGENQRKKRPE